MILIDNLYDIIGLNLLRLIRAENLLKYKLWNFLQKYVFWEDCHEIKIIQIILLYRPHHSPPTAIKASPKKFRTNILKENTFFLVDAIIANLE